MIFAQARFPKPEFTTSYTTPNMDVESSYFADDWIKFALYFALLVFTTLALYKYRSRKLILLSGAISVVVLGFYFRGCPCPIGLMENTLAFLFNPNSAYPFVFAAIFILPIVAALFFGRIFCGGACPLGAVQELLLLKPAKIPYAIDSLLRLIPYFVLSICASFAVSSGPFISCMYDPFVPIFRGTSGVFMAAVCALVLILCVFVSRPYCKYFCPYSILLRFSSYLSSRRVKIAPQQCVNCRLCEGACPNGAIILPQSARTFESFEEGRARVKKILLFLPLFIFIGTLVGYALGMAVLQIHPTVVLFKEVSSGAHNDYVEAFYRSGMKLENLQILAEKAEWLMTLSMSVCGAIFAFAASLDSMKLSRRKANVNYEVDMGLCVCCGRCYSSCPDAVRLKKGLKDVRKS